MADASLSHLLRNVGKDMAWYYKLSVADQRSVDTWAGVYAMSIRNKRGIGSTFADAKRAVAKIDQVATAKEYQANPATAPKAAQADQATRTSSLDQLRKAGIPLSMLQQYQSMPTNLLVASVEPAVTEYKTKTIAGMYGLNETQAGQNVLLYRQRTMADLTKGLSPKQLGNLRGILGAETQSEQSSSVVDAVSAPVNEKWDRDRILELQERLKKADPLGYGSAKDIHTGMYDARTSQSYSVAVLEASRLHLTIDEYLDQQALTAQKKIDEGRAGTQTPFVAPVKTVKDPEEIKATINAHFQKETGRRATPAELNALTKTFHSYEDKQYGSVMTKARYEHEAQNRIAANQYDRQLAAQQGKKLPGVVSVGGAPTVIDYNPEAEAAAEARRKAPTEAGGVDMRQALSGFLDAIKG